MPRRPKKRKSELELAVEEAAKASRSGEAGRRVLEIIKRREDADMGRRVLAFLIALRGLGSVQNAIDAMDVVKRGRLGKLIPQPGKDWTDFEYGKADMKAANEMIELRSQILAVLGHASG